MYVRYKADVLGTWKAADEKNRGGMVASMAHRSLEPLQDANVCLMRTVNGHGW